MATAAFSVSLHEAPDEQREMVVDGALGLAALCQRLAAASPAAARAIEAALAAPEVGEGGAGQDGGGGGGGGEGDFLDTFEKEKEQQGLK